MTWISMHVFYSANQDPMLVECVTPLVARLRRLELIRRYFFIKYWQEGPHVRLRLQPAQPSGAPEVRAEVEAALAEFLRRRPALYELDPELAGAGFRRMFLAEYGERQWDETYGRDGVMPLRSNNSYAYIDYEPEYSRYGGPAGVDLAEWHFERSSDVVLHLLAVANTHVRSVQLGLSAQLAAAMCLAFLDDPHEVAAFLDQYRRRWEAMYDLPGGDPWHRAYRRGYQRMAPRLRERLHRIRRAAAGDPAVAAADVETDWLAHCRELRDRVVALAAAGDLVGLGADPDVALRVLLSSYLHMTNNRLGVSIFDEIYLAFVLRLAILPEPVAEAS